MEGDRIGVRERWVSRGIGWDDRELLKLLGFGNFEDG